MTTPHLTDAAIEAIEQRANAATEGPWYTVEAPWRNPTIPTYVIAGNMDPHVGTPVLDSVDRDDWEDGEDDPDPAQSDADLRFAAHARQDIPALLADRRARIAELAAVTAERDVAKNMADVWRIRAEAHRQGADAAESALAARDAEVAALRGEIEHLKVVHVKPD